MKYPALLAAILALAALPAPAYYHFIHYLNGANVPEKFDLSALPNKTVSIFVSENGPQIYSQTDTFNSVLSQIRQATAIWNGIASSDLRVSFGGLENTTTPQNTPGGDVVFEDLPPGLYGYGGPTSKTLPVTAANGSTFIPILRSTVHLNRNLTLQPGPSFQETFLMTVVHELGHALGLQHTFTSSTMSQATTRSTTMSRPVENDDIAGISVLYPTANFGQLGSISGRITSGGQGVHLASVVAIRPGAGAVSALTNPDGTYHIDGIPPGQYFLYVHTLPPDADIKGPWNADNSVAAPSGPSRTLFYPGTTNVALAAPIPVQAGNVTPDVNISTSARSVISLYDDVIYSYFNNNTIAVQPGFVNMLAGAATVSASGYGLGANGQAPGLNVQFIGNSVTILPGGIRPYLGGIYTYIALDLGFTLGAQTGPHHIVYTTPDEMYVLPSGLTLTVKTPPTISAIAANPDGTVIVAGTNWGADTRLYFDGLPSTISSLNLPQGLAIVQPPPGASGQQATITAYNSDGQNSQILQSASPVTYSYGALPTPAITSVNPASLPAGAEATVDITGTGFNFVPGLTTVGFGTSDIAVRRIFVLSPTHLQVDVSIAANAALSNPDVSVISGFQLATVPAGFQITPLVPGLPTPIPVLLNAIPGLNGAWPGAYVSLFGVNLSTATTTAAVTIGGQPITVLYSSATQLNLLLPPTLTTGPATMLINTGLASSLPITVNIDPTPAAINAIQYANGNYIDVTHPVHQGELIIVTLANFAPAGATIDPSRVLVSVGGVSHSVLSVNGTGSAYQVSFLMNATDPVGTAQQLVVYLDGHSSYPASVAVAHPNGTFTP